MIRAQMLKNTALWLHLANGARFTIEIWSFLISGPWIVYRNGSRGLANIYIHILLTYINADSRFGFIIADMLLASLYYSYKCLNLC